MFSKTLNLQHAVMFNLVCRIVQEALFSNRRIPWGITCSTVYFSVPVFVISNLPSHLGKSWSSSFDCFNGFISLIITQLRASPCENTQEAFYTVNKLIVAVVFLTRLLLANPFQISNRAQLSMCHSLWKLSLPKVNQFRQLYSKVINDKHDDVMAKFGAILAQGILDAG